MSEKHSIVIEEYLLLLYQLRGAGERLKAVTLAQRLKSSAPTVHATLQRMQRDELIQMDDKKEINPDQGRRASRLRHCLSATILQNIFSAILWGYPGTKYTSTLINSNMR
jgi:Mn-dependent DtxR family transcriptional regulator